MTPRVKKTIQIALKETRYNKEQTIEAMLVVTEEMYEKHMNNLDKI